MTDKNIVASPYNNAQARYIGVSTLSGSFWYAEDSDSGKWKFQCMPDGNLRYEDALVNQYHINRRWHQAGDFLYIELNDLHCLLRGTITGDNIEYGLGQCIGGRRFRWTAMRCFSEPAWKPCSL